jgi:hypothetical protein
MAETSKQATTAPKIQIGPNLSAKGRQIAMRHCDYCDDRTDSKSAQLDHIGAPLKHSRGGIAGAINYWAEWWLKHKANARYATLEWRGIVRDVSNRA